MSGTFKSVPFTPGPWRVRQESGSLMNTCFVCADDFVVCKVANYASDSGRELPNESNADLIAAAPALFASCGDLTDALDWLMRLLDEDDFWPRRGYMPAYNFPLAVKSGRKAIAQATGEADTTPSLPNQDGANPLFAELLQALKELKRAAKEFADEHNACSGDLYARMVDARDIIAKASGETISVLSELDLPPTCGCECPCVAPVSESGDVCEACAHGTHWTTEGPE